MANNNEDSQNDSETIEKTCAYCKKKAVEHIICVKCEKPYHKSCITRLKTAKIISSEKGICCYDDATTITFITALIKENEAKDTEIRLLKKLNKEMEEKNCLLKEKIQNTENNIFLKSYASVAANPIQTNVIQKNNIKNIPSLIIKPKDTQESSKTRKDVDKNINPTELNIGVNNIRYTKAGNVIIKCGTKEDTEALKIIATQKLNEKYEVEETKLKKPRIKICHYYGNKNATEIENSIRKQNKYIEESDEIKVTYIKKTDTKGTLVFAECSSRLFNKIMYYKKIYIGWERYPVYEDISLPQCYHCYGYYHKNKDCRNKKVCVYCAGEHLEEQCPKQIKKCNNCAVANNKYKTSYDTSHEANSKECPTYKYLIQILRTKINYSHD